MAEVMESYVTGDDTDDGLDGAGNGKYEAAMTFTVGNTGADVTFLVSSIDIKIFKTGTPGDLTVQIQDVDPSGQPNGTVLSTGTITEANMSATANWENVTMSSATLIASQQYALVIDPATPAVGDIVTWRLDAAGGTYGGGNKWLSTTAGQTGWAVAGSGVDYVFRVNGGDYQGTLCSLAEARNKMGANVATGASSEPLISDWVRQAEGVICAVTRFDWVDSYSALSADVKFILNQVASDMAAIYGITYDMSGFTDRVEAETMINVYRESTARGLSLLRDQNVKKFITGDT